MRIQRTHKSPHLIRSQLNFSMRIWLVRRFVSWKACYCYKMDLFYCIEMNCLTFILFGCYCWMRSNVSGFYLHPCFRKSYKQPCDVDTHTKNNVVEWASKGKEFQLPYLFVMELWWRICKFCTHTCVFIHFKIYMNQKSKEMLATAAKFKLFTSRQCIDTTESSIV